MFYLCSRFRIDSVADVAMPESSCAVYWCECLCFVWLMCGRSANSRVSDSTNDRVTLLLTTKVLVALAFLFQSGSRGALASVVHLVSVELPPIFTNFVRTAIGAACFALVICAFKLVLWLHRRRHLSLSPSAVATLEAQSALHLGDVRMLGRIGVFSILQSQLPFILIAFSAPFIASSVTSVLISTMPLFAILVGRLTGVCVMHVSMMADVLSHFRVQSRRYVEQGGRTR
jgi:hypothetical protein